MGGQRPSCDPAPHAMPTLICPRAGARDMSHLISSSLHRALQCCETVLLVVCGVSSLSYIREGQHVRCVRTLPALWPLITCLSAGACKDYLGMISRHSDHSRRPTGDDTDVSQHTDDELQTSPLLPPLPSQARTDSTACTASDSRGYFQLEGRFKQLSLIVVKKNKNGHYCLNAKFRLGISNHS